MIDDFLEIGIFSSNKNYEDIFDLLIDIVYLLFIDIFNIIIDKVDEDFDILNSFRNSII